ncbi:MAG: YidB family protein [Pseudolabrys sp.]|nr:YidB family protein [Pseudolabrys sp.]MDP2295699.1 YidB family protein [Pseudolabrys sp.]
MGLMDILNGMQNGPRGQTQAGKGGMSKITMAMLALLAYKAYQKMGTTAPQNAPAGNPNANQNANQGGGLGDILGGLFGGRASGPAAGGGGLGGLLNGGLGGLLAGGAAGGLLSGGLGELIKQFQQSGKGDTAQSWVSTGPNQQISPDDLGNALGDDTVNSLAEQAGISRIELLNGMSEELPRLVDTMTPEGHLPDEPEMSRLL